MNKSSFSARASSLTASEIRIIGEEAMTLENIIPLYFGESAWPTTPHAVNAAVDALQSGDHFYQPNNGRASLRQAISAYLSKLHNQPIDADRITVTASGTQALAIVAQVLVDPGHNVICIQPGWPNIAGAFEIAGARISYQNLYVADGIWKLDLDALIDSISESTRVVIINSPSNPTGWVMPGNDQRAVLEKCRQTGTWLVFDEVYSRLYRHGQAAPSPLDLAAPEDRVISINSFSKAWSMTGWRLGWITAPAALFSTFGKIIEFNIACAPGFVQAAGEQMIREGEQSIAELNTRLAQGYDQVENRLSSIPRIGFVKPEGAFYAFFSIDGVSNSLDFAQQLLRKSGVGLAPGSAFGAAGNGKFRLCYAQPVELVKEAIARIDAHLSI